MATDLIPEPELACIANNIRTQRLALSLTQAQLAERAKLDVRQIQRMESGKDNCSGRDLFKVARALGLSNGLLEQSIPGEKPRRGRPKKKVDPEPP